MGRQKEQGQPEEKETNVVRETISFIIYIGIVFLLTYLVIHYVGQRTQVSGSSMEATLSDGDNLIVDKISYRFHDPERYDIIVFPYKYEKNTFYIKRIIGLPGETVQIDGQGNIYVDGEVLDESYGREVILDPGEAEEPITLEDDEYFVLGDNRNASSDSRDPSVGKILGEDIIGRAWVRIFPFNKIGFIKHK
ncbi:MAG: signal peptidase I [Lachnospiraceae bacterium]|nr:signal peptidase I [Lachnospiraceae bacterium]